MYGAAVTLDETDAADVDHAAIANVIEIFFSASPPAPTATLGSKRYGRSSCLKR
jgi:hypothetical protein